MSDDAPMLNDPAKFLYQLPFVKAFQISIVDANPGELTVEMPFDPQFATPPNHFPASMVGTVGDVAAVSSCLSRLTVGWLAATLDFTIKMTNPAAGEKLIAKGRALQVGKTTSVGAADVFAVADGTLTHCASLLATARNFKIRA